jgi:hypothetical protein
MKNHKACMKLIDLYRLYTERKDQDFRLWNEDGDEVFLEGPDDEGDIKIQFNEGWPTFISEFKNPLKSLQSLRVVQVTTVVANGKVVSVKKQKGKHL